MKFDSSSLKRNAIHYCMAIGTVVIAYAFRRMIEDSIGGELPTYVTFYPAVMLSALLGGIWAGLLATAASALITAYWILPPQGFAISHFPDAVGLALFSSMGMFLSVVAELYRRTQQKVADYEKKQALWESEELLRIALQAAQAGYWEWDLRTNNNHWSAELWKLYGLEPHSTKPSYYAWLETIRPEDQMKTEKSVKEAVHNGTELAAQWRVNDPVTDRWLMSRGHPLRDESGDIIRYIGIVMDITELKRTEKALRESEEGLLAANEYLEQRIRERTMDLQILMGQLEKSRDDLRKLASELVLTEERERKRIATVLHDEVAQTLAAARMRVDMLQQLAVNDDGRKTLVEIKELLAQSIKETRALMTEVGNPLLFDMGVSAACSSLADRLMSMHPVRICCDIQDSFKNLNPDVKVILFQVIRELLNNIVKHSKARNANVLVKMNDGHIRAEVRDDGMGFDPQILGAPTAEGGFGLYSIRERLMAFNGSLEIESNSGTGTVVTVSLPVALDRSTTDEAR